jgi:hypothetical protein
MSSIVRTYTDLFGYLEPLDMVFFNDVNPDVRFVHLNIRMVRKKSSNHVGLIVNSVILPNLHLVPNRLYVWECVNIGSVTKNIQIRDFEDIVLNYRKIKSNNRINDVDATEEITVGKLQKNLLGKNIDKFMKNASEVLHRLNKKYNCDEVVTLFDRMVFRSEKNYFDYTFSNEVFTLVKKDSMRLNINGKMQYIEFDVSVIIELFKLLNIIPCTINTSIILINDFLGNLDKGIPKIIDTPIYIKETCKPVNKTNIVTFWS